MTTAAAVTAGAAALPAVRRRSANTAWARFRRHRLALFGLGTRVHDVLKLTRLLGYFQIFDSEEQAVAGDEAAHG